MRTSTIVGLSLAVIIIFASIYLRGGMEMVGYFIDLASFLLVFGCTAAAMTCQFTFSQMIESFKALRYPLVSRSIQPEPVIEKIVEMAVKARKEGFIALRELSTKGAYPLLDIGIDLMADGTDLGVTRGILETVSEYLQVKLETSERFWKDVSIYSPMFGMIGTLIGLIMLLKTLTEPETIAPNMSMALVTTFYGIGFAGLFCMPVAGKIRVYNNSMGLAQEIIIEGVAAIQAGDNSQIVREKLQAYLAGRQ